MQDDVKKWGRLNDDDALWTWVRRYLEVLAIRVALRDEPPAIDEAATCNGQHVSAKTARMVHNELRQKTESDAAEALRWVAYWATKGNRR